MVIHERCCPDGAHRGVRAASSFAAEPHRTTSHGMLASSRSTLSLLEKGETVTVTTLIQVLRVLDKLKVMEAFTVKQSVSPLAAANAQLGQRKRASGKRPDAKNQSGW